uniref:Uncharacterized protein n=1 Tax=Ascaris lumbricoides TaxID=6252 RepID=A0A0M3HL90_ASCLU
MYCLRIIYYKLKINSINKISILKKLFQLTLVLITLSFFFFVKSLRFVIICLKRLMLSLPNKCC